MTKKESSSGPTSVLKYDYIKSNSFRVIHVDGAWGGLRPDLNLHLSLYNERHAIPRSISLDLDAEDLDSIDVKTEGRESVIREVEVCAVMDMATARGLRDWLNDHLELIEQRIAEMKAEEEIQKEED